MITACVLQFHTVFLSIETWEIYNGADNDACIASYHVYLSKDVFILCKQQYSSPVVALHDRPKCWEQQYQCQTISKVTFEATSVKQCG